jgi:arsenate reductase
MITLYGIKNCDSIKKSRKWLDKNSIEYVFHDFRIDGVKKTMIKEFIENIDITLLINKRSTSWKKLSTKEKLADTKLDLIELLIKNPTIIKRPIIKSKDKYLVGFSEEKFKLLK